MRGVQNLFDERVGSEQSYPFNMEHSEYTTILRAIGSNDGELMKTVKDTHYLFSHRDLRGQSYLHLAVRHTAHRVVKSLIEMGFPVDVKDATGCTSLMSIHEESEENITIAQDLILAGADVNVKNLQEMTPLHVAVRRCLPKIVKVLLDSGANPNAVDQGGDTPLISVLRFGRGEYGKKKEFNKIIDLLVVASEINHTTRVALYIAALRGDVRAIDALAKKGADLEARYHKFTPLQIAAMKGQNNAVKCLLEHGANTGATTYFKPVGHEMTAHDFARYCENYRAAALIREHELTDDTKHCSEGEEE